MMRKVVLAVILGALSLGLSAACFAQSSYYVLTNDDNMPNTATLFNLSLNGTLTQVKVFDTGGTAFQGGFYAGVTQLVSNPSCIFVSNGDSGDIAAFSRATKYAKVGNYSDPSLSGATNMPMVENQAGTLLYAAYQLTSNLAVWTINADCSLSIANIYSTGPYLGSLAITHDGKTLLGTYVVSKQADSWAISGSTLTDNGMVSTVAEVTSIAVTNDDKVVIMGTGYFSLKSTVVTASLPGFINQKLWTLGPGYSAASIALSPDAAAGSGCLYFGNTGSGFIGRAGVTGVMFTENPLNLTYVNNVTSSLATYLGSVETIKSSGDGGGVYAAEVPGYVGVYFAGPACHVTLAKETADPQSSFILSLSSWVR